MSTGSAVALPFYALGRAPRLGAATTSRAPRAATGPSTDRPHDRPHPGRAPVRAVPALGRAAAGTSAARCSTPSAAPSAAQAASRIRKVVVTLGTYKDYGFPRLVVACSRCSRPRPRCCGRRATRTSRGLGVEAPRGDPGQRAPAAIREADVVVAHAGVGAALDRARGRQVPGARACAAMPGVSTSTIIRSRSRASSRARPVGLGRRGRPHTGRARGRSTCERENAPGGPSVRHGGLIARARVGGGPTFYP